MLHSTRGVYCRERPGENIFVSIIGQQHSGEGERGLLPLVKDDQGVR